MFHFEKNLLHKCVQWAGGERISHLPSRNKIKLFKKNLEYLNISAPTNLQYESRVLVTGTKTSIKQYGKNGDKK